MAFRDAPEGDQLPRRDELLRAGWELIDELPLGKIFAGVSSAAVAERAGVTTGSFFHHFSGQAAFADAMVWSLLDATPDPDDTLQEFVDALDHLDLTEVLRSSMLLVWEQFTTDPELAVIGRRQMHLWSHKDAELGSATNSIATVGDVLRECYLDAEGDGERIWAEVLRRTDRIMVEPFTVNRVVVGLSALFQGLLQRHAVDSSQVDPSLFADLASVLIATLTQPAGGRRSVGDIAQLRDVGDEVDEAHLSPQARVGATRRAASRRRISAAAAGLFTASWEEVTVGELAGRSKVSPQTVLNAFGSVRAVAAATFERHINQLGDLAAVSQLPDGSQPQPAERLAITLARVAEVAAAEPGATRALLDERLAAQAVHLTLTSDLRASDRSAFAIDEFVPLDEVITHLVEPYRTPSDPDDIVRVIVDLTLQRAIAGAPPHEAAALALRLLPTAAAVLS